MGLTITKKDMESVYGKTYTDILKITKRDLEKVYGSSQPAAQPTKTETQKYGTVNGEINLPYHINNQELYTPPGEKDMVTAALEGFGLAGSNFFKNIANLSDNAKAVFAPAVQTYKEIRPMINDVRKAGQITDIAKAKQQEYGAGSQFESDIVQKIKAREEAQDLWTQQVYDNHKDVKYGDKIINFAYNAGNAVPSVLAGAATASPAVGKLVYGLNTFGGDIGEAVDDDASLSQATNYATADTSLQLRLSNLSGGMPFLGNGKISVNGLTDKYIQNEALRWLLNRAFDSAGEGAEEVVTELINPYLKRATYDKDAPNATPEQLWNSFKGGANTAALFGIASDIDKVGSTFDKNDLFYKTYSDALNQEMIDSAKENKWENKVNAGKATVIKSIYQGDTPIYVEPNNKAIPKISDESIFVATKQIIDAKQQSLNTGKSLRNYLKDFYNNVFENNGGVRNIKVKGLTFGGKDYIVTVNKNVVGKTISDPNLTVEKLAVFDVLNEVVENAEFVGSGEYIQHSSRQKNVIRYDYFETDCIINNIPYIVTFDVEVVPGKNNYRTHKVINKINLTRISDGEAGPVPAASDKVSG